MSETQTLYPNTNEFAIISKIIYVIYTLYCFICYIMMSYYSFYLLFFSDITFSHLSKITHPYYGKLILWALQYLIIDTFHKYYDRLYLKHYYTNDRMYNIMLLHHILGITTTMYIYLLDISHISGIALYTFEFTSIFLLLFSLKIKRINLCCLQINNVRNISLWLFWSSFLVIRVIYGNIVSLYLYYLAYIEQVPWHFTFIANIIFPFLLLANNSWFYKLHKIYKKSKKL